MDNTNRGDLRFTAGSESQRALSHKRSLGGRVCRSPRTRAAQLRRMRLPVVPAVPWRTAVPPSYQVVPMEDTRQVLGALSQPAVSVVQLTRGAGSRQLWPQGSEPAAARADTRVGLSAGAAAASDDVEVGALLDTSFGQAPPAVLDDMRGLLRLFARCAMEEGGATADTRLAVRLVVSDGVAGACSQLHIDRVALRLF